MKCTKASLFAAVVSAASLPPRQDSAGTATVDLLRTTEETKFLGSGFIYGFPDNGVEADISIPGNFLTDVKFQASRAGGAQLPKPASGWSAGGYETYIGRFNSSLSNYRSTRKYGGSFILLPHDLWGSDGSLGTEALFPGDNGDWSELERFYEQLIDDLQTNDMLEGLVIDLWNEPELDIFWNRPWEQYLEYYSRAHHIVRAALPDTLISGPSGAHSPNVDNSNWNTWLAHIAANDAVPDIYSWHHIGEWEREPDRSIPDLNTMLETYGLPQRPVDVNEYATPEEQNPGTSAFFLAQLERHNIRGLRANWGSGAELHDYLGDLIYKDNNVYRPNGDWYLYKYYANMTGSRAATQASEDILFDAFAVVSGTTAKIIAGTRLRQSAYDLRVSGISALGLPSEGEVAVRALQFDWAGKKVDNGGPADLGVSSISYTGDVLTIFVNPPANSTAFAYEIVGA